MIVPWFASDMNCLGIQIRGLRIFRSVRFINTKQLWGKLYGRKFLIIVEIEIIFAAAPKNEAQGRKTRENFSSALAFMSLIYQNK